MKAPDKTAKNMSFLYFRKVHVFWLARKISSNKILPIRDLKKTISLLGRRIKLAMIPLVPNKSREEIYLI